MLSEEYFVKCTDDIVALYNAFVDASIIEIAKSIRTYYTFDEINRKANLLIMSGTLKEKIIKKVAILNKMSQKKVREILEDAGKETLKYDDGIYMKEGFDIIPMTKSPVLMQILETQILNTDGELKNLTKSTASAVQTAFINAVDTAEMQVQTGFADYNTAIKNAVFNIVENGGGTIVEYPTGHKSQLDVAVRRCVLTGVSKSANKLQMERAKEMQAPYADTSAHAGARPSHAEWQGKRFSINNDGKFPPFAPILEQLDEYNCRHSWYPVFSADEPYSITKKQLDEINEKTVESGGKKYTYYEAEQRLRQMERTIRKYKRRAVALEENGQDNSFEKSKIRFWQKNIRQFVDDTGLDRRRANEQIYY